MVLYDILNAIFAPLINISLPLFVIIVSLLVSLIITLVTKYFTDQNLMKRIREDMKDIQKQIKESKSNPSRVMELQKKSMELTMQQFKHSFKPTLITFLPIILIFGWLSSAIAYEPIHPNEDFAVSLIFENDYKGTAELTAPKEIRIKDTQKKSVEGKNISWTLNGKEGKHLLEFQTSTGSEYKEVLITNVQKYEPPTKTKKPSLSFFSSDDLYISKGSNIQAIKVQHKKLIILPIGYKDWFGWLGTYILFSIAFTIILRKLMKVY